MALLSEQDRQTVRAHLAGITRPVSLLFFTQTIDAPETATLTRQVLDEIAGLSDKLSIEEVNLILERDRAAQFGIDRVPAIALLGAGEDTRMRFLGAPSGYEFVSLVEAAILAGTGDSGLAEATRTMIAGHVTSPLDLQVFVTPT
jgi:alkyl hydroperoxide reductase subunit AhpF